VGGKGTTLHIELNYIFGSGEISVANSLLKGANAASFSGTTSSGVTLFPGVTLRGNNDSIQYNFHDLIFGGDVEAGNPGSIFYDYPGKNYSLKPGSPGVDAGNDNTYPDDLDELITIDSSLSNLNSLSTKVKGWINDALSKDVDGNPRKVGAHIDVGAFELQQ
jgi:hypothetical protein